MQRGKTGVYEATIASGTGAASDAGGDVPHAGCFLPRTAIRGGTLREEDQPRPLCEALALQRLQALLITACASSRTGHAAGSKAKGKGKHAAAPSATDDAKRLIAAAAQLAVGHALCHSPDMLPDTVSEVLSQQLWSASWVGVAPPGVPEGLRSCCHSALPPLHEAATVGRHSSNDGAVAVEHTMVPLRTGGVRGAGGTAGMQSECPAEPGVPTSPPAPPLRGMWAGAGRQAPSAPAPAAQQQHEKQRGRGAVPPGARRGRRRFRPLL
jgi:hypothetical protein